MVDWWSFGVLLFELLHGTTPFRGSRRDETFDAVVKRQLAFPPESRASPECRDLITRLLHKASPLAPPPCQLAAAAARGAGAPVGGPAAIMRAARPPTQPCSSHHHIQLTRARPSPTFLRAQDPAQRLGSRAGADEIKAHPFFSGLDWALIRMQKPPHVPPHRTSTTAGPVSAPAPGGSVQDSAETLAQGVGAPKAALGGEELRASRGSAGKQAPPELAAAAPPAAGPGHIDGF
jgi:serine/threonine protein kinase